MPLTLKIIAPSQLISGQVQEYKFDELGGSIGRKPTNDFILLDPERFISSKHAIIEYNHNKYFITDTSTNGVFINNSKAPLGTGNSAELMHGDKITIGEFQLIANLEETAPAATPWDQPQAAIPSPPPAIPNAPPMDDSFGITDGLLGDSISSNNGDVVDPLAILGGDSMINDQSSDLDLPSMSPSFPADDDLTDGLFGNAHENIPEPSPINEPFTPPNVIPDPTAAPEPQSGASVIPDDWDIMGDSNPPTVEAAPAQPAASGFQNGGSIIPNDEPLFEGDDIFSALETEPLSPQSKTPAFETPAAAAEQAAPFQQPVATAQPTPTPAFQQAPTANVPVDTSYFDSFLQGAGINPQQLSIADKKALMHKIGSLTRTTVTGIMTALRARATIKSSFRVNKTTIAPVENNPLKFLVTADDALIAILSDDKPGYMPAEQALTEGFKDLQNHQMALMAGMQATINSIVNQFDPNNLERSFDIQTGSSLIPGHKKSKNWDCYVEFHSKVAQRLLDDFQNVYGEDFAKAYEAQINKLL